MPTNPPPCYRCGMRPSMLPIAYCAECYQLTGARLLTAVEVAAELGLERTRIHQLSRQHGIGLPAGPRNTRLYTPAMVETLRTIRRPGGRPVTYLFNADYDTIIYETHRDGSPALWLETTPDGVRTLNDDGGTPLVLAPGDDVDEAVAAWRESVAWEVAIDEARAADDEAEHEGTLD